MQYRELGKTGWAISEISLGTWQVGGGWGDRFDGAIADQIINTAIDAGVNFIDTADVYYAGKSEEAVGKVVRARRAGASGRIYVASKCGRGITPHDNEHYTVGRLREAVENSLRRTGLECIDLIQLHCPPPPVYGRDEVFGLFDDLRREGKICHLGVSVERIDEGLAALSYDNVVSIQVIFNIFRQRPASELFAAARERGVGVIVRVPLASGLLSGKITADTTFPADDHRTFNREGAAFDKGETFSGVPLAVGVQAVEELRGIVPETGAVPLAVTALRWILAHDGVSTVIPGASKVEQVGQNAAASVAAGGDDGAGLSAEQMGAIRELYDRLIAPHVHHLW